ncbi:TetR/AcrR family transcriptional regulator [Rhodococcus sp. ABRD24]|uniref:TetR/AcrR family transcriptional regulator n=1 Tax=Rhodococcus sp. ABRD24 TaxID=2507582 RepID=UPI00103B2FAD|nr:TetR/AcrR family transcriptional regulator [Rhodococcus sp. ABRD24]QBJ96309.1 TetR/AcrR family transcriptional regulator [Rhodococcus sp. ABRD24]
MRTVDETAREAKRTALLDAAADCFAERGYNATRTADICAAAGMSSGNLFHYFPTKHAVLLALVEREGNETAASIAELSTTADPFAALLLLLDEICRLAADPTYSGLALEISALAHRDEDVSLRFKENDLRFRQGLESLLRRADEAGQLDTDLALDSAATWLAGLVDGMFARVAADPDFEPATQAPVLRRIVTQLLSGRGR